jgi:amino acid adenylation domain-containing protein
MDGSLETPDHLVGWCAKNLHADAMARLEQLAAREGVSLAAAALTSWAVLQWRCTAQDDVAALGAPGISLANDPPLRELLRRVHATGMDRTVLCPVSDKALSTIGVSSWAALIDGMTRRPEDRVSELPLLSTDERRRVLHDFNATSHEYPLELLVHELIEDQVKRTPHAVAVWCDGSALTYAQLNAKANQLARFLRARQVGPDELVAISIERSLEMVVGLLGIIKAGGGYIPVDPSYPAERINYMLQDARPRLLLTQQKFLAQLETAASAELIALDVPQPDLERERIGDLGRDGQRSSHLAYVIYTSGSTGQPKGAMNEHRGLVNRLLWMQDEYRLDESDRVLQKTPFSFDVSVWEFLWPLMTGARLVMARPGGHQDPAYLIDVIERAQVTTLHFVPSMLQAFLHAHRRGQCASVRRVICSGEELPASLQRKFFESFPRARLANLYGPTEAAIDVTAWECQADSAEDRVPIGRPIANIRMYVLDRHLQPVPIGVAGEIYIGGIGVGRGYLNRPELTRERFLQDPFDADSRARLYRTGDLGRWREDGAIEYLSRNDHQVKVRGFRIELGEIEAQLAKYRGVQETVVVAREDRSGEKRLVAYFTTAGAVRPSTQELRAHLKTHLPEHMVPAAFVPMEAFPLSPNGKLDRRALPAPGLSAYSSSEYEAPRGTTEQSLAQIWQQLLGVERVGRRDNFFELGGHSLLLTQLIEQLREAGLCLDPKDAYTSQTLADLAVAVRPSVAKEDSVPANLIPEGCRSITAQMLPLVTLTDEHIQLIAAAVPGGAANIQDIYPLVPLQQGVLFHHLMNESGDDPYIRSQALAFASRERVDQFIAAVQAVVDRHDALRTAFFWKQLPHPVQVVCRKASLTIDLLTLADESSPVEQLEAKISREPQRMALSTAPLIHLHVASSRDGKSWYGILQTHHLTFDDESLEVMLSEIAAHMAGRGDQLPPAAPFRNHVARTLAAQGTQDHEEFFRRKLGDLDETTAPYGIMDVRASGASVREASERIDAVLADRIRSSGRRHLVSPATIFHAAWALVVAHTSRRDDVAFGSVLLGRMHGNGSAGRTLGMFINTLPLRLRLNSLTSAQLLAQAQGELAELLSHEQVTLSTAQHCSGVPAPSALFTALLNYLHGSTIGASGQLALPEGIQVLADRERTNYPLVLTVNDREPDFLLTVQADQRIDARRVLSYVMTILTSLIEALDSGSPTPVLSLPLLPVAERQQVLEFFNATDTPFPINRLVNELFEEQERATPDAIAIVDGEHSLTYREFNTRANQLAHYLRAQGAQPGEFIPILMPRCLQMLVAQLAVLKCGATYLPLDPALPDQRRAFILADCGARHVVTQCYTSSRDEEAGLQWIDCAARAVAIAQQPGRNLENQRETGEPAYVMYTSGSTGTPKGVVVPHRAITRLVIGNRYACIEPQDCLTYTSNPAFDAATFEVWGALLNGARVAIVPQATLLEASELAAFIERHRVTAMWITAGLFAQHARALAPVLPQLRYLITGGDVLDPALMSRVLRGTPPQQLVNGYGPTECTTFATTHVISLPDCESGRIPIGRPISNTKVYILDSRLQPVPIGVAGEIHIGGPGVALGYLNRPELTAERFIPDPFTTTAGACLYRTGDLGRWTAQGQIEFLGRNDTQVKVRGYRIEPGEIEARLSQHSAIDEAVVLAREDVPGEKRLVAYVTRSGAEAPDANALSAWLGDTLPEYMVPSAFVVMDRLPLNTSGKVDRRALPAPGRMAFSRSEYEPPQGQIEEVVTRIWHELLRQDRIGRRDDFFALGGHSLIATRAMTHINAALDIELPLRVLFEKPTVEALSFHIAHQIAAELSTEAS